MKKFKFKFQKILEYKQTIEDLKRAEYSSKVQELNNEKDRLKQLIENREKLNEERNSSANSTTVKNLQLYNNYLTKMNQNIVEQKRVIESKEEEVEEAKDELIKSVRDKKTFEKLKTKHHEEYKIELKKEEENIVDQIVSFNNSIK